MGNTVRVLHTGDLHLGSSMAALGKKAEPLRRELCEVLGKITDTAKEYGVDAVLICGDFSDSGRLSKETLMAACEKFSEIKNIPVYMILGNHDIDFSDELPENVFVFGNAPEKISLNEYCDIYGCNYSDCFMYGGFYVDCPDKINIMLMHGTVGGNDDNPVPISFIADSGLDYLALGHIHEYSGLQCSGGTYYAYCGVPLGRGFDETGEKGVVITDICKGNVTQGFVKTCTRQFVTCEVNASGCADLRALENKITELVPCGGNLYKINVIGKPDGYIDFHTLQLRLSEQYFYIKICDCTSESSQEADSLLKELFREKIAELGGSAQALDYGLRALDGERIIQDEDNRSIY